MLVNLWGIRFCLLFVPTRLGWAAFLIRLLSTTEHLFDWEMLGAPWWPFKAFYLGWAASCVLECFAAVTWYSFRLCIHKHNSICCVQPLHYLNAGFFFANFLNNSYSCTKAV